jgi:hypothetical protein
MMGAAAAARWTAIAIAVAAVIDPPISLPRSERPVVRVVALEKQRDVTPIAQALRDAGFTIDATAPESATVLVGRSGHAAQAALSLPDTGPAPGREHAVWALDTAPAAPNVRVTRVVAPPLRFPAQAVEVRVEIEADGISGQATDLVLEQSGIPVATARHQWAAGQSRWQASLQYLPPGAAAATLRVRASVAPGETSTIDNIADVAVPAARGPVRALVVEAAVTWPAVFVRRALEGEPAFDVSSVQRAAKGIATRAGDPPAALSRSALAPFEVVFVGGPDNLGGADLDALGWFVEERGGIAVFIPDQRPSGRYVEIVGVPAFASRTLAAPVRLGPDLQASELLIPTRLPAAAVVVAADNGAPVVFSARRGAGAVVFSGALDAWRHRAALPDDKTGSATADEPFARFWRSLVVANAASVPPPIEVSTGPSVIRPGERTSIAVRLRDIPRGDSITLPPIAARVIGPGVKVDEPVRLWPTVEPGVYEGEWRARLAGLYNLTVAAGDWRGDATIAVADDVTHATANDAAALAQATGVTGGQAFPIDRAPALVEAMQAAYPPRRGVRPSHPMRSPWWVLPFAGLLCAEWAVRRKRGLP